MGRRGGATPKKEKKAVTFDQTKNTVQGIPPYISPEMSQTRNSQHDEGSANKSESLNFDNGAGVGPLFSPALVEIEFGEIEEKEEMARKERIEAKRLQVERLRRKKIEEEQLNEERKLEEEIRQLERVPDGLSPTQGERFKTRRELELEEVINTLAGVGQKDQSGEGGSKRSAPSESGSESRSKKSKKFDDEMDLDIYDENGVVVIKKLKDLVAESAKEGDASEALAGMIGKGKNESGWKGMRPKGSKKGARWMLAPVAFDDPLQKMGLQLSSLQVKVDRKIVIDVPSEEFNNAVRICYGESWAEKGNKGKGAAHFAWLRPPWANVERETKKEE